MLATGCGSGTLALCSMAGLTVNAATGLVWGALVIWAKNSNLGGLCNDSTDSVACAEIGFAEASYTACKVVAMIKQIAIYYRSLRWHI